jgi:hypothetical protein
MKGSLKIIIWIHLNFDTYDINSKLQKIIVEGVSLLPYFSDGSKVCCAKKNLICSMFPTLLQTIHIANKPC